ncbi:MAG: radical SAM protein, partial [Clostridiales bacterium]|nr:radical SAM protein [Clostridiales bacterium]
MKCYDCPRACGIDRDNGNIGVCGVCKFARVAKIIDTFDYEEPCLGTVTAVFFGGCSLGCSYCQNYKISRGACGEEYNDAELAGVFDRARGAIDLVTPSHYMSAIERAVELCENKNSFIFNTSGYETTEAVKRA